MSITPNTTEALFAIGAGSKVVGRSKFCDFPPAVSGIPAIGGYVDPSFEAIVALRPDLVVGARGPAGSGLVERLETRGISTYFPNTESVREILEMIDGLGQRIGHGTQAHAVVEKIQSSLGSIETRVRSLQHPRVLLIFGLAPIVAAGPGSFPDEMLRRAGATNVFEQGVHYPTVGMETVLALHPDIVVDAAVAEGHGDVRITNDTPGWTDLEAVQRGRVFALNDNAALRPGPRVAEGVAKLVSIVHPEAGHG